MKQLKGLILQMCKFSAVGTSCFVIDYVLMIVFTELCNMEYLFVKEEIIVFHHLRGLLVID